MCKFLNLEFCRLVLFVSILTIFSMSSLAQEKVKSDEVIANPKIIFSQDTRKIEKYLHGSLALPFFQQGAAKAVNVIKKGNVTSALDVIAIEEDKRLQTENE